MMAEFFEHPLTVDAAPVGGMVEDVHLPESEQELVGNRVSHYANILARPPVIDGRL